MKTSVKAHLARIRNTSVVLACLGTTVSSMTSCGILGDKKSAEKTLAQDTGACLDELGPLAEEYLAGSVNEGKWRATWDCVDETIDMFKKFVKGSEAAGYSSEDIRFLMQKFLFSRNKVTSAFVNGALAVKASLFGGKGENVTNVELDRFRELARFLKEETTALIPHLRNRKTNPTPENMRSFADAVDSFGTHLADYLNTSGNPKLTTEMAIQFLTELSAVSLKSDPKGVQQWTRFLVELKVLLLSGATDGISGADWAKILKFGFRTGGAIIAYLDMGGDDPLFQLEMIERIQNILKTSLNEQNGMLPFAQIERVLDHAPNSLLPTLADDFRIGAKALLKPRRKRQSNGTDQVFRPAMARLLQSRTDHGLDTHALDRIVAVFRKALYANYHLNEIYAGGREDLSKSEFAARAANYRPARGSMAEVNRLITIANRYPGMHPSDSKEILFGPQDKHSLTNLNKMSWYETAAEVLLEAYGTGHNAYGRAGYLEDLTQLIEDLNPVLFSINMVHPNKIGIDKKRFREANLFMPSGDGNDLMDLPETAVYFAYLFSASSQALRITDSAMLGKEPCKFVGWNIPLKLPMYEVHCFRDRFKNSLTENFKNMPLLRDEFARMNDEERDVWYYTLEYASKITGYDDEPVSTFDVTSFSGLPHFAEGVMHKFDMNRDGALDRSETLNHVFPVFKRELATISKIKIDFVNKAVLLYLMQYGKEPKVGNLLTWALGFEFLKKFQARRIRVYQIFAALSPPGAADPISQDPPPGSGGGSALAFTGQSLIRGLTTVDRAPATVAPFNTGSGFDLGSVDPVQFQGYPSGGPIIDPSSPYQEALEVLPQDL